MQRGRQQQHHREISHFYVNLWFSVVRCDSMCGGTICWIWGTQAQITLGYGLSHHVFRQSVSQSVCLSVCLSYDDAAFPTSLLGDNYADDDDYANNGNNYANEPFSDASSPLSCRDSTSHCLSHTHTHTRAHSGLMNVSVCVYTYVWVVYVKINILHFLIMQVNPNGLTRMRCHSVCRQNIPVLLTDQTIGLFRCN